MANFPDNSFLEWLDEYWPGAGAPRLEPVTGGSIASAWKLARAEDAAFLKVMPPGSGVLAAEAAGLAELSRAGCPRVPAVLANGEEADRDWLLMEWLPLETTHGGAWARMGTALAAQHQVTADAYGWHRDNFIGVTSQPNPRTDDWVYFFDTARIGHQLALARQQGLDAATVRSVERLREQLPWLLDRRPAAALLHGDLWSGNLAAMDTEPVVYDPAVYYGDREADLAMMELFGAPPAAFWQAYEAVLPLAPGYSTRRDIYNLYHLLNHFNLFGGGFGGQVRRMSERLVESGF